MKWQITGADRATGEDRTIEVEAHDERQAQLSAKALGLLVEKIEQATPIPDYHNPPPVRTEPARTEAARQYYYDLADAARGLFRIGTIFSGLGWAAIVLGLFAIIGGVVVSFVPLDQLPPGLSVPLIAIGLSLAAWGAIILFAGELGRTVAEIGKAIRDLTINSHK